ncbi:PadR family transcriptional regulator [Brevundimonas sp.]|jgi:PadR family transcriptional regulator PadR|uniref:PadR family transcriptional regulator n=1 Tax=Brevundimonas sp. TaxID=1871086 RepID=UPI0022C1D82C|nr:PadR family transcriptional regulator [Brevundimonas sp.]MCZ8085952.1 PadR family transcriptional regulator [Brevundimonas sp.]MCZ8193312.1 PadR family transcriptional regulator [Brevundimonas sp.]
MVRPRNASAQTRLLLARFADQPQAWQYGYELSRATGIGSGTLYPTLARLSDQGLLESEWRPSLHPGRPPRHAYRLTTAGIEFARTQSMKAVAASNPRTGEALT